MIEMKGRKERGKKERKKERSILKVNFSGTGVDSSPGTSFFLSQLLFHQRATHLCHPGLVP
jgi:hypothetical protein